jgi:hypothetical protein
LRVIAPLRMAISLPRAAFGGGDSKPRASWPPIARENKDNYMRTKDVGAQRGFDKPCGALWLRRFRNEARFD